MMWAARLEEPGRIASIEAEPPTLAQPLSGDVLLRILAGGICGSDVPKFRGLRGGATSPREPTFPGPVGFPLHEVVGEVVVSGSTELREGQRVVGWAGSSDGLAELVVTAATDLVPYDPRWSPTDAVLIQPLACVLQALDRVPVEGKRVAVLGLGTAGILFAHAARVRGARHVVGVDPVDRSELADVKVADELVASTAAEWVASLDEALRPDVVIEAVGHQVETLDDAVAACAPEGTVLYFGIPDQDVYPIDMERIMRQGLTLIGGVTRDRRSALLAADAYLADHPDLPGLLITHRFDRATLGEAFETACRPAVGRLKVVLDLARN